MLKMFFKTFRGFHNFSADQNIKLQTIFELEYVTQVGNYQRHFSC